MRRFVQIATKGMCGNFNKVCLSLSLIKTTCHMRPIYILTYQFSLSSFGAKRQCCNLQSVDIRRLELTFSDLRILIIERVSTCQYNRLKFPFVLFSQTAGTRLYWCRRQSDLSHLYRGRLSWQFFLAVSTVSQYQVTWSPYCIKGIS